MNKIKASTLLIVIFFLSVTLLFSARAFSQPVPPFKMTLSDNKIFNASELPKGKPLVLIYFDPDCDHCQRLMDTLFKKINSFKKAELVLITYKPVTELASFEKKHDTHKYTNMKVGTEGTGFYLRNYFKLMIMPFTALYDKNGNYSYSYRKETPVDDLLIRLKALE